MARVNVSVNVRDMTGGDLARLRARFNRLSDSMDSFAGNRSQGRLEAMQIQFGRLNESLRELAGRIPHDEFERLTRRTREFGAQIHTATGPQTQQQLAGMRQGLRDLGNEMNRLNTGPSNRQIRITARDDTDGGIRSAHRRLLRFAAGPVRGIGGLIGGTLSDGIGQGLVGAFRSPTFGAVVVAALVAALAFVGAALAGVLVTAIGGAFVGLGVFIALQAKGVSERWAKTLSGLKPIFADAAKPMIPVIDHARQKFDEIARDFAPHFKEAMERAVPTLNGFLDSTKEGFRKMGQHAWDDLQTAFRTFLTAFGPQWEDFLSEFGKSLGALSRTVTEHSTEIAAALRGILGVINLIIDIINFFANLWVVNFRMMIGTVDLMAQAMAFFTDVLLGFFEDMLQAADVAFGWIPGLDGKLANAREAFSKFRESTNEKLMSISERAKQWGRDMDTANKTRKLQVDIDSWTSQLARAKEDLKSVPPEKRSALLANIADLESKIRSANGQLAGMQKDYYVRIHAYKVGDWAIGGGGPFAHGGVVGRAATGGVRSNMTLVGEQGPEIVNLPPGSHVRSNSDSRRFVAGQAGGVSTPQLVLKSSGRRVDDLLIEVLRESIKQRGGDPVIVLGGTR